MPSNLVGAQRARLLCNYFEDFGWKPIVLAANPEFYEEPIIPELLKLVKPGIDVRFVNVHSKKGVFKYIGDLALRGYQNFISEAIKIIKAEKVDFVWLPIPSYYNALLGRPIHKATGVPYGIDYIDPWVNGFPGQEKIFSKAWLANQMAKILEPYSVKNASLISGVTYNYYAPVLERNFKNKPIMHCAMQYGFDLNDYSVASDPFQSPWDIQIIKPLIYAGAFLPKSHLFIKLLFQTVAELRRKGELDPNISLFFLGTGFYQGIGIMDYAKEAGIEDIVTEKKERLSYLQILFLLKEAFGIMVIGSTEKHYSASKVFQSLLSLKPVFSIFHRESEAASILENVNASQFLALYEEDIAEKEMYHRIYEKFERFLVYQESWKPALEKLSPYSSKESARILINEVEKVVGV